MPTDDVSRTDKAVVSAAAPIASISLQRQERLDREAAERLRLRTIHQAELESALKAAHERAMDAAWVAIRPRP